MARWTLYTLSVLLTALAPSAIAEPIARPQATTAFEMASGFPTDLPSNLPSNLPSSFAGFSMSGFGVMTSAVSTAAPAPAEPTPQPRIKRPPMDAVAKSKPTPVKAAAPKTAPQKNYYSPPKPVKQAAPAKKPAYKNENLTPALPEKKNKVDRYPPPDPKPVKYTTPEQTAVTYASSQEQVQNDCPCAASAGVKNPAPAALFPKDDLKPAPPVRPITYNDQDYHAIAAAATSARAHGHLVDLSAKLPAKPPVKQPYEHQAAYPTQAPKVSQQQVQAQQNQAQAEWTEMVNTLNMIAERKTNVTRINGKDIDSMCQDAYVKNGMTTLEQMMNTAMNVPAN